jgi:preprotein translocase subunit SecB
MAEEQPNSAPQRQLILQKIYVKDLSFESPKAPMVFTTNVSPQTQLNVRSSATQVAPDTEEVTLTITVQAKDKDSTLFLAEVAQAGIFLIQGYTAEERALLLGSFCPNTLYPFAREAVADLVTRGGFPPLLLQPLNFDAIYAQALQERAARANAANADQQQGQEGAAAAPAAPSTGGETH